MISKLKWILELLFAVFLLYLLLTRAFLSWLQFAPEHFTGTVQDLFAVEIRYDKFEVDQHWLGFEFEADRLSVKANNSEFESGRVAADLNLLSLLLPISIGGHLTIEDASLSTHTPIRSDFPSVFDFQLLQAHLQQPIVLPSQLRYLWQQISIKDFRIVDRSSSKVGLHIQSLEWVKASQLSLVSEFSVQYQDLLTYQPMSLTLNAVQNGLGNFDEARLSLVSYRPVKMRALKKMAPLSWQNKLPSGDLMFEVTANFAHAKLSNLTANFLGNSLQWQNAQSELPSSLGFDLRLQAKNAKIWGQQQWSILLSEFQSDNDSLQNVSPIKLVLNSKALEFEIDKLDVLPGIQFFEAFQNRKLNEYYQLEALVLEKLKGRLSLENFLLSGLALDLKQMQLSLEDNGALRVEHLNLDFDGDRFQLQADRPLVYTNAKLGNQTISIRPQSVMQFRIEDAQNWHFHPNRFQVDGLNLSLERFSLREGKLVLKASAKVASLAQFQGYLPFYLTGEVFQEWFENSEAKAEAIEVKLSVENELNEFLTTGNGLSLSGEFQRAYLKFDELWPSVTDFNASFVLNDYELTFMTPNANLFPNIEAQAIRVATTDLRKHDVALEVSGKVATQVPQAMNYLQATPLIKSAELQDFVSNDVFLSGESEIKVDSVWVPISGHNGKPVQVDITTAIDNVHLEVFDFPKVTSLSGSLRITEGSIASQSLQGRFLEGPIDVAVDGRAEKLHLDFMGQAHDPQKQLFKTTIPWSATVTIPYAKGQQVRFSSKLDWQDGQSLLPAPFSKNDLTSPLEVKGSVSKPKVDLSLKAEDVGLAEFSMMLPEDGQEQKVFGDVFLGEKSKYNRDWQTFQKNSHQSVNVNGFVDKLEIEKWIKLYQKVTSHYDLGEEQQQIFELGYGQIAISDLRYKAFHFPQSQFSWGRRDDANVYRVIGPSADVAVIQQSDGEYNVQVGSMLLHHVLGEKSKATDNLCSFGESKGVQMPIINFHAKHLQFKEYKLRNLAFTLAPHSQGYAATGITGVLGDEVGRLNGAYSFNDSSVYSSLVLDLKSKKVQKLASYLGVNKGFSGESATGKIQASWLGDIACFDMQKLEGPLEVKIMSGKVDDVEPGLARLLGLLSIDSLVRRLQLDLKDVTNQGFAFDSITAKGRLNQKIVHLDKLKIDAPSVNTLIKGDIRLQDRTFDMSAMVTPAVGSSLATVAAVAGATNPLAAIAIYALMKAIPEINEELITFEYDINGPWSDPKLEIVNRVELPEEE